jgi:hypothetical protein
MIGSPIARCNPASQRPRRFNSSSQPRVPLLLPSAGLYWLPLS